jgi:integrase
MTAFRNSDGWDVFDQRGRRKYVNSAEGGYFLEMARRMPARPRAFCQVIAYTGCRISEALSLTIHRLDVETATLAFLTLKRRKRVLRTVPIPPALAAELALLPLHQDGRFWTMDRTTAWRLISGVMERCAIAGPMACPRGLRHGFAVRAIGHNVPITTVQRWMGHASLATTAIYLDVSGPEERQFASRMW